MKTFVYINGKIVPEKKALVSVFDRGLNYGDGLFETVKAYDGEPAFLRDHLSRLRKGISFIGIHPKHLRGLEADIKKGVLKRLLKANGLSSGEAYLKVIITRGADKRGHEPSKHLRPTCIIIAKPVDAKALMRLRENGVKAVLLKGYRPALPGIKSLNYLPNVLGKMEAKKRGAYEGIFVDEKGFITEGTSTNVFILKNGVMKTPPVGNGALPGVARKSVIEIAKRIKFPVRECRVSVNDLMKCDQAFLTNSIIEVVPLVEADGKRIGKTIVKRK